MAADNRDRQSEVSPLLAVEDLDAWYGPLQVLRGVNLEVRPGEVVGLFGHNGAGKSTVLKSLLGIETQRTGRIRFAGEEISRLGSEELAKKGIGIVPQGVGIFGSLRVGENVLLGAERKKARMSGRVGRVTARLPVLEERWQDYARTLSGGQRQMVSIGRALVGSPRLLLLDEPSVGLAPRLVREVMDLVQALRQEEGVTVLLVEQNITAALRIMDRGYVIRGGKVVMEGAAEKFEDLGTLVEFF